MPVIRLINNLRTNAVFFWLLTALFTAGQTTLKVVLSPVSLTNGQIFFHIAWVACLHVAILQIMRKNNPNIYLLWIFYFQLVTPLVLCWWVPELHLAQLLSLPWLVILSSRFLLGNNRIYFSVSISILFLYSVISLIGFLKFIDQPELLNESLILEGQLFQEFVINLNTFAFSGILFLIYLVQVRYDMTNYAEDQWHSKWYVTLISHLSHNLRTPLTQITTNLSLLGYVEDPEQKQSLQERMKEGTDEMKNMINAFISASSVKNLESSGQTIIQTLETFTEGKHPFVTLKIGDTESDTIRGPEVVSLLLALNSFVEERRRGEKNFSVNLSNGVIKLIDINSSNLPEAAKELERVRKDDTLRSDPESYFIFKLLRESGWKIDIVEDLDSYAYHISRVTNKWVDKASF